MTSFEARVHRIAVMLDFENIVLGFPQGTKLRPRAILSRILEVGNVVVKRAYADWSRYESNKVELHQLGFDLLEIPRRTMTGKNSADIRMVVDAMELVISKEHIDTFVIVSGDSDFSPLVAKLREHDKQVVGIGVKAATSKLLIESCDEFIFYEEIEDVGLEKARDKLTKGGSGLTTAKGGKGGKDGKDEKDEKDEKDDEKLGRRRAEALYLVLEAARGLVRRYDTVWGSMIKQTIVRKHPSFNESYHGYSSFSELVDHAFELDILKGSFDEKSGNYRITGVGKKASSLLRS